jgi:hypothetical protein
MRLVILTAMTLVLVVGLIAPLTAADETTLSGTILCAKCGLKKADAKACQNVLVVKDGKGGQKEYYITKNAVGEKFGDVCTAQKAAVVTGAVTEKDGKTWVTPSKIDEKKG